MKAVPHIEERGQREEAVGVVWGRREGGGPGRRRCPARCEIEPRSGGPDMRRFQPRNETVN